MEKGITVKELKKQLSRFPDDTEVMIYEAHFEHTEPCDCVVDYAGTYDDKEEGKCFIHYWAI